MASDVQEILRMEKFCAMPGFSKEMTESPVVKEEAFKSFLSQPVIFYSTLPAKIPDEGLYGHTLMHTPTRQKTLSR